MLVPWWTPAPGVQGYSPVLELPLPEVELERVGLQYDGQTCYANVEARQVPVETWRPLEAAVQPQSEAGPLTWLDGGSRAVLAEAPRHTCCAGEVVGVDVELRNPLQVDLALTRLRLACTFEASSSGGGTGGGIISPSADGAAAGVTGWHGQERSQQPQQQAGLGFEVREESITLRAGERVVMHLRVWPLQPGRLEVGGVAWKLGGVAQGLQRFQIPRPKPLKPGTSRVVIDADRPPPGGITLTVLSPMPRLEVAVEGLESTLLVGELVRCRLRLHNTGAMALRGLAMAADNAGIYLAGSAAASSELAGRQPGSSNGDLLGLGGLGNSEGTPGVPRSGSSSTSPQQAGSVQEASGSQGAGRSSKSGVEVLHGQRQGVDAFSLPPALELAVGDDLVLPIWFRWALIAP